jgi:NADPH:quinone reductase-like Zn-dependent oxidoreductase
MRTQPGGLGPAPGLLPRAPPRGIGLDVSGTVDAVGDGVTGVDVGDFVFGVPDFMGYPTAGASDSGRLFQRVSTSSKPLHCRWPSKRRFAV